MDNPRRATENVYEKLFRRALELVYSDIDPERGFPKFVDECAEAVPSPAWDSFRRLDIPADLRHFEKWLRSLFENEPALAEINGLYFGISDPLVGIGYELYLSGSTRYDSSDVDLDWAADQDYWPEERYSRSEVFHALWKPSEERQLPYQLADDAVPLVYAGLAVGWLLQRIPQVVLGRARLRAIAFGHDEGDAYLLGTVDSDGYHRSSLRAVLETFDERRRRFNQLHPD